MGAITPINRLAKVVGYLRQQGKSIVVVGGCFDVLHPGHVGFLEKAKKTGDTLVVLLEGDKRAQELKGINRPFHAQKERAKVLSALRAVDYVVLLPFMKSEIAYDQLLKKIQPDIIAVTAGQISPHHQRAAILTGAKVQVVTRMIGSHSSSRILDH